MAGGVNLADAGGPSSASIRGWMAPTVGARRSTRPRTVSCAAKAAASWCSSGSATPSRRRPDAAVIRGSAVNQDGRTRGSRSPIGPAQEAVVRKALSCCRSRSRARSSTSRPTAPEQRWVTRSRCGRSGRYLGEGGRRMPLLLGSVKSESRSFGGGGRDRGFDQGRPQSMQHGEIPPHLHFEEPSPHIPFEKHSD